MRRIKFKAWDISNKKMLTNLEFTETQDLWLSLDGEIYKVDEHNRYGLHWSNYKLLQYTGLKDKNGKEIYEGDIIESTILGKKFRGEVFWETCGYRVKEDDLDITLGHDKEKTRKVVGNIYENEI